MNATVGIAAVGLLAQAFGERRCVVGKTLEDEVQTWNTKRERRVRRWFHIEQNVSYKMLYGLGIGESGVGKTVKISSGGVCFTTENMLTRGMPVELSMNWPALLNGFCPMKLMIYGCVIRSTDKSAALAIERYEFRTQGALSLQ